MKKLILLLIVCLILFIPNWGVCNDWTYNINAEFGIKELDDGDYWEPVDSQIEYGILLDFRQETWLVNIAIDILHTTEDGTLDIGSGRYVNVEGKTLELALGTRKIWALKIFRPFIGGGIAFISAKHEGSVYGVPNVDDDSAIGVWINGGLYLTIKELFNIGFNIRWSKADVSLFNEKRHAGGLHYGLITGYHF